ncbi:lycopene cyclase family protein [Aquimarina sp. M1]
MQKYDYIITGTGASGLMLAYYMVKDTFFDQKKILLIDKEVKNQNDRTWCFWEKEKGSWDAVVSKKWNHIFFGSADFSEKIQIAPYQYKLIRSNDFYHFIFNILQEKPNITIVQETLINFVDEGTIVKVETDNAIHLCEKVFSSVLLSTKFKTQKKYPLLNQHFIGWFIRTKVPAFRAETATFMDFNIDQKGNTRFMYVLPFSETEALFEYTLFSKKMLSNDEYETEIKRYLESQGIKEYQITKKEKGCIPMTSYEFRKHNSKNVLHVGTAGGWTKPSTGFTFYNTQKKVRKLIKFLKKNNDLTKFGKRRKFWYYDLLLLDLLSKENQNGARLFTGLFKRNEITSILKFLDEETSFIEELKIMSTMPAVKFLKIAWNRLLRK